MFFAVTAGGSNKYPVCLKTLSKHFNKSSRLSINYANKFLLLNASHSSRFDFIADMIHYIQNEYDFIYLISTER